MKTLSTQCPSRPSLVAVFNLCPWLSLYWIKPTPLSAWPTKSTRNHLSYFSNFHFPGQIPSRIILDRSIVVYLAGHNPGSSHCSHRDGSHIYCLHLYRRGSPVHCAPLNWNEQRWSHLLLPLINFHQNQNHLGNCYYDITGTMSPAAGAAVAVHSTHVHTYYWQSRAIWPATTTTTTTRTVSTLAERHDYSINVHTANG